MKKQEFSDSQPLHCSWVEKVPLSPDSLLLGQLLPGYVVALQSLRESDQANPFPSWASIFLFVELQG